MAQRREVRVLLHPHRCAPSAIARATSIASFELEWITIVRRSKIRGWSRIHSHYVEPTRARHFQVQKNNGGANRCTGLGLSVQFAQELHPQFAIAECDDGIRETRPRDISSEEEHVVLVIVRDEDRRQETPYSPDLNYHGFPVPGMVETEGYLDQKTAANAREPTVAIPSRPRLPALSGVPTPLTRVALISLCAAVWNSLCDPRRFRESARSRK